MSHLVRVSTGLPGLDEVINYLRMGDNVVLQVNYIDEYIKFVTPFVNNSLEAGKKVIYMRFARHRPIMTKQENLIVYEIDADHGFESFSTQVHQIITTEGRGVFYVFDCLSDLLYTWATDLMIGNFFLITCPYLYELDTVAYFAIYKNSNSFQTIADIRDTTQILLDVYEVRGTTYVHPLKVWNRYAPTMFLPHVQKGDEFIPVTSSGDAAALFANIAQSGFESPRRHLDFWDRIFLDASELYERIKWGEVSSAEEKKLVEKLCRLVLSRDERFLVLLKETFSLRDLLYLKSRLIGSGFIGGKAVGMLLARNILLEDGQTDWSQLLEQHDSYYVGSDVFYTYLVQNGLWKLRMEQRKPDKYLEAAAELKERILIGRFPENIREQFLRMLEYFGQSPIIVRSSSLLEDGFGNAFAGKYESFFCINQGTPEQRYFQFEEAVRKIFASTMNENALAYRLKRGLADQDEQMALLVQRVSGSYRQEYFFPDVAGVGYSYNTYVWDREMDPKAGMLRVVAGLGTRAVNRMEGDYARIIALDNPLLKPYAGLQNFKQFSQHEVDLLDIAANSLQTMPLCSLADSKYKMRLSDIAERDYETERIVKELRMDCREEWIITFDVLSSKTNFPQVMQKMMKTLEKIYRYPVDIEFTVNFTEDGGYRINLLQCRPLQVEGLKARVEIPVDIEADRVLFKSVANFMGGNIHKRVKRVIFVEPQIYSRLSETRKYEVARTVGRLNRLIGDKEVLPVMLLGPGRWGTTTPSLGIPVSFAEINNMTVLGEVAYISAGYAPEVSFGTHFFQDLVESEIFYVALFPEREGVVLQSGLLDEYPNILPDLLPQCSSLQDVIRVHDIGAEAGKKLEIAADTMEQVVFCFFS